MNLPNYITKYLWDVNQKDVSPETHSAFIIERILEYGDLDSFNWLETNFKKELIIEVLSESKKISPKTGNFYALYYGLDKSKLLCIRKPFIQKQNRF